MRRFIDRHAEPALLMLILWASLALLMATCGGAPEASADDRKISVKPILASATYGAGPAAYSGPFEVSAFAEGIILVDVTAETESSTMDIVVQTSPDSDTWFTHSSLDQITATGQYLKAVTNFGKYLRIRYVVAGTAFAFSVQGVFKN